MNEEVIATAGSLAISRETLRAFAKGQLDEATEQQVLKLLESRPDLAAQVAAISADSILEKMKKQNSLAEGKSLSSQLSSASQVDSNSREDSKSLKATTPLTPPSELAQLADYKIINRIGQGGMGVVYLAKHLLTGRKEVLKVLNERLMTNNEARKRFDQEIKCIAAMNHETIVRCYTVKQLPHALVLCMEYVAGTNLHQFIHKNGPLPTHVACTIACELCRGLQHAMDNGLVHRDIKPSNIMLYKADGKIKAKILDFGLARLNTREKAEGLTDDGTLLGTLEYIAPEQCLNAAAADIRSDIYSLGCTLYHMLVGHPPFSGSSGELVLAHSTKIPPAVNLIQQQVPLELANIVAKMLAKDPAKRFPTPLAVATELQPFAKKPSKTNSGQNAVGHKPANASQIAGSEQAEIDTSVEMNTATTRPKEVPSHSPLPAQAPTNARTDGAPVPFPNFIANEEKSPKQSGRNKHHWVNIGKKSPLIAIAIVFTLLLVISALATVFLSDGLQRSQLSVVQSPASEVPPSPSEESEPKETATETGDQPPEHADFVGIWYIDYSGQSSMIVKIRGDGTGSLIADGVESDGHTWGQLAPGHYFFRNPGGATHTFRVSDGKVTGKHNQGYPFTGFRLEE